MIIIGCDHAGCELKTLILKGFENENKAYEDFGCNGESVDYPDIAKTVCERVMENPVDNKGILICGTGIGMSIAANKIKGIRAAVCGDYFSAKYTRMHNDSNVICLGARTLGNGLALELLDVWLNTEFEGGRHSLRIDKIIELESELRK